jgi:hypothetical protein
MRFAFPTGVMAVASAAAIVAPATAIHGGPCSVRVVDGELAGAGSGRRRRDRLNTPRRR